MIISRKKYEKLNCDLVRAKAKIDDAKRVVDAENKLIKAMLVTKQERDKYKKQNEQLKRKALAYDKMMTGEMGELYKKAEAFDEIREAFNNYGNDYILRIVHKKVTELERADDER